MSYLSCLVNKVDLTTVSVLNGEMCVELQIYETLRYMEYSSERNYFSPSKYFWHIGYCIFNEMPLINVVI